MQLRLQRAKADAGPRVEGNEKFSLGMVLDCPARNAQEDKGPARRQVDLGLPLQDAGEAEAGAGKAKAGPDDSAMRSTPNQSMDEGQPKPEQQQDDHLDDAGMKARLADMQKRLEELQKVGTARPKYDGYRQKLGLINEAMTHRLARLGDQDWDHGAAKRHAELLDRVVQGKALSKEE